MTELCDLSALELRALIGAKRISPVELLASCRARILRIDGAVNAFVATCWDRAEAEARAAERAVMAGDPLGPLFGLPIDPAPQLIERLVLSGDQLILLGNSGLHRFEPNPQLPL